ncbi:hypothetical protein [Neisseria chenwenguii]|uniref:hypothetical protein n=1 Tax=Neisseria chenwenguii TaxID=1853278 RepID=UPI000F4FD76F|nr:hypothetical protein [Neisseria chenwenguii]
MFGLAIIGEGRAVWPSENANLRFAALSPTLSHGRGRFRRHSAAGFCLDGGFGKPYLENGLRPSEKFGAPTPVPSPVGEG